MNSVAARLVWSNQGQEPALSEVEGNAAPTCLSPQFLQHLLRLGVIRMLFEELEEHGARFARLAFQRIDSGEVQVRLIKGGRHPDALFEACDRFIPPPGAQVKYTEVVQRFRITGTKLQGPLQILVGAISVVELRKDHSQAVVRLGTLRAGCDRSLKRFAGFIPALLLAISVPQIFQRDQVIGTQLEGLLKVRNSFGGVSLPRGEKAEVVPGVRQSFGIARMKFDGASKTLPRFSGLLLFQVD